MTYYELIYDPVVFTLSFLILVLVLLIIYALYRMAKTKKEGPSHIELYFDTNFRRIIDEWDLMPRSKLKDWKADMNKRLSIVDKDLSELEKTRKKIDNRLRALENEILELEKM